MQESADLSFPDELSARMRAAQDELSDRWLASLPRAATSSNGAAPRAAYPAQPTHGPDRLEAPQIEDALSRVGPSLLSGLADCIAAPSTPVAQATPLMSTAALLSAALQDAGVKAHEAVDSTRVLADVLCDYAHEVARESTDVTPADLALTLRRIFDAASLVARAITSHYVTALDARLAEREARLEAVRSRLTHELKNRIGAVIGAGQLLQEEWIGTPDRTRFASMVVENAEAVRQAIADLSALSRNEEGNAAAAPPLDLPAGG